jgi:hypothetical protein
MLLVDKQSCLLCRTCDVALGRRYCRSLGRQVARHEGRDCGRYSPDTERVAWPETWETDMVEDIIRGIRVA